MTTTTGNGRRTQAELRARLTERLPVSEGRYELAGIDTAVLEGGDGEPIVLLHGPGESSLWWMRVIPGLATKYRVIAPDLPGHGATETTGVAPERDQVLEWLDALIRRTCSSPPVLTGHILGGAIAARFAVDHGDALRSLVLVDTLGLGKFRPAPGFAYRLFRFMLRPTRKNYDRFLPHCMNDVEGLRVDMDERWEDFIAYNLACAGDSGSRAALRGMMQNVGVPPIPPEDLERIRVPTSLIWGRKDRANDLEIAERASERFAWPLYVIDEAGDDPKMERPEAFIQALDRALRDGMARNGEVSNGREMVGATGSSATSPSAWP